MPKVVVYVPAKAWKALEARGLDPARTIREFAKRGYEMTGLTERAVSPSGDDGVTEGSQTENRRTGPSSSGAVPNPSPAARSVSPEPTGPTIQDRKSVDADWLRRRAGGKK